MMGEDKTKEECDHRGAAQIMEGHLYHHKEEEGGHVRDTYETPALNRLVEPTPN
jgi:hypothetical protein